MRVRQLSGGHHGDVVEMPYAIALRAIASGAVEALESDGVTAQEPAAAASAVLPIVRPHGKKPRTKDRRA